MKTLKRLSYKLGPNFNISNVDEVKSNLLKLDIYFDDISFEELREMEEYPVSADRIDRSSCSVCVCASGET